MGMAASQARFLGLTARKSNVEYEGQQINQQRTALSNQSANYYNQMLGMQVPVPPSVNDYTKTVYTFSDGALENTITSMIAQANGNYKVSYLSSWVDDFSFISAGCTSVVNAQDGTYFVGKDELKPMGDGFAIDPTATNIVGEDFRLTPELSYTKDGNTVQLVRADYDKICQVIGPEPQLSDYDMADLSANYKQTQCYSSVYSDTASQLGHIEHNLCKLVWDPDIVGESLTSSTGRTLTSNRALGLTSLCTDWGTSGNKPDATTSAIKNKLETYYPDTYQELFDLYIDLILYMSDHTDKVGLYKPQNYKFSDANYDHNAITAASLFTRWENFWSTVENLKPEQNLYDEAHAEWQAKYNTYVDKYMNTADYTDVYTIEQALYYDGQDAYLASLTSEQLSELCVGEKYYVTQLNEIYGEPDNGWYVRYKQDSTTGEWYPIFYNGDDMAEGITVANGDIYSNVKTYKIGSCTKQEEIKQRDAKLEQDSSGRYINLTMYDANGMPVTYALTTNTTTDNAAYDDAMNQYEYDKYQYDQKIHEINAKIEIVQAEDKNLELRLKQLDTEQDAIQTEMDAVSKVIEKNVESTFKTFG